MVLRYSIASGNWSANATWDGAASVPGAADIVEIRAGHTVTIDAEIAAIAGTTIKSGGILVPAFSMVTSAFANIVIDSGGMLYASRTVTSFLRCAGTITANGAPGVDYGTDADPLSDNTKAAAVEFVCTSDAQTSRGFVLGANDALSIKGATRVRESTLSDLASIGANTIILAADMALRPGTLAQAWAGLADFIIVGHTPIQTGNGAQNDETDIYRVADYNPATKTVTLGDAGLGDANWPRGGVTATWNTIHATARQIGTPVTLAGANVVVRGSAYNLRASRGIDGNFRASVKNSLIAWNYYGINAGSGYTISGNTISGNSYGINAGSGYTISGNTISGNSYGIYYGSGNTISGNTISGNSSGINAGSGHTISGNTISGNASGIYSGSGNTISGNTISGNSSGINAGSGYTISGNTISGNYYGIIYGSGNTISGNTISGNSYGIYYGSGHTISGNTISGNSSGIIYGSGNTMLNNIGSGNTNYLHAVPVADLYNCLFSGVEHSGYNSTDRLAWHYVASDLHNQIAGAWKAWCSGGIVTKAANVVPPGKTYSYEHACEPGPRATPSPVFRQLQYTMKRYEKLHYRTFVRKEVTMTYRPRIQIIDYFADPLVDVANVALAETVMTDSTGTWEVIDAYYFNNSDMPKKVLLRTLAMNATGIVYFYPSIILNSDNIVACDSEGMV
jgi:parallel beta-helix repeat protein